MLSVLPQRTRLGEIHEKIDWWRVLVAFEPGDDRARNVRFSWMIAGWSDTNLFMWAIAKVAAVTVVLITDESVDEKLTKL